MATYPHDNGHPVFFEVIVLTFRGLNREIGGSTLRMYEAFSSRPIRRAHNLMACSPPVSPSNIIYDDVHPILSPLFSSSSSSFPCSGVFLWIGDTQGEAMTGP